MTPRSRNFGFGALLAAAVAAAPGAGYAQSRPDTSEIVDNGTFRHFTDAETWRRVVPSARLRQLLEHVRGRRPEIRSDFDVHLVDGALIYLREACGPADVAASFLLHLEAVDPDDLPAPRRRHGFDNLDFRFHRRGTTFGGACLAVVRLPAYDVEVIRTGQYHVDGGFRPWEGEIRFGPDGVDRVEIARSADPPIGNVAANRIEFLDGGSLHEPVLWYGGRFQFRDICPEWGCLAVQFGTDGEVAHAWPYRPHVLEQAASDAVVYPHVPPPLPVFSFVRDVMPQGIAQYPNGDLLVVFYNKHQSFLSAAIAARIDRRGYPVWLRRDGSHHWPHLENDGSALALGVRHRDEPILVPLDDGGSIFAIECPRRPLLESVNVIDGEGRLLDSIDLTGAMLDSPFFAPVLIEQGFDEGSWERCNPLHANFVHRIGDDVRHVRHVSSGDLVVSMRNLSAFAILDAESGRVKQLVRGGFRHQHAVHHWRGSQFLLFDNDGSDGAHGPPRLLMVDLADGRETTIFPNAGTPEALRGLSSLFMGKISISPDRRRALVAFTRAGVAVEVRLSDGAALNVFRSLHDVSNLEQFPEERATQPAVFMITGLDYVDGSPW